MVRSPSSCVIEGRIALNRWLRAESMAAARIDGRIANRRMVNRAAREK